MKQEEFSLKGRGVDFKFLLNSGGIRVFVWFAAIIGAIAIIFTIVFAFISAWLVPLPIIGWGYIVNKTLNFLLKKANSKNGWAFFLNTHYLFRYFEMQMSLTGDKKRGKAKLKPGNLVQPILNPGDILTEAKLDNLIATEERRQQ